jgi:hypothetical protein
MTLKPGVDEPLPDTTVYAFRHGRQWRAVTGNRVRGARRVTGTGVANVKGRSTLRSSLVVFVC